MLIYYIVLNSRGQSIMKKKMRMNLWGLFLILISIFILINYNTNNVSASLTDSTDLAVLKDAPDGIGISSYMSNSAPTVYDSKDIYNTNSAQIVDHSGANTSSGNVISLASAHNTYGSMWSTKKSFDITKEQTISAWLYFGDGTGDTDAINSEGIAFVLQNDSHGIGALGAGLEGMGVYGYDASLYNLIDGYASSQSYIQNTAIKNSVALEFDTSKNNFYDKSNKPINNKGINFFPTAAQTITGVYYSLNGYDTQLGTSTSNLTALGFPSTAKYGADGSYGHIALTYPGLTDTYQPTDLTLNTTTQNIYSPFTKGFVMVHVDPKAADLSDETDSSGKTVYWHHVTIKWHPATDGSTTAHLEYNFNDLNQDGTANSEEQSETIPVDTTKLNTTDNMVRWGFTAANGPSTSVASKLVALDSTPDTLYASADSSIVDTTLANKTITTDSTDKTVSSGDSLNLNYNLKYEHGNEDWKQIAAKIKIPDHLTTQADSSGNIGYITYNDANKTKESFTADELQSGYVAHTLAKTLGTTSSAISTQANITIYAKADTVTTDTTVAAAPATFTGSNEITDTNSPTFKITAPASYTLKLTNTNASSDIDLLYKSDNASLDLPTEINYSDNHSFGDSATNTNITYKITAGGKTYTVAANATGTTFDQTIDLKSVIDNDTDFWNLFTENSTNKVTVTAIDQANGLVSNTLTYNVNTKQNKSLSLTVSNNLSFKDVNYGDDSQYLTRKKDFDLSVTSLREPWQLNVTTDGLYLDGKTLNNNMALVYKESSDSTYQTLSSTPTLIDKDTTSHSNSYTDNISDDWKKNTGLLLEQLGTSQAGTYTGTLTWEVSDVLGN